MAIVNEKSPQETLKRDRIYMADVRRYRFCVNGIRNLLAAHGYKMSDLEEGIPIDEFRDVDNAYVQRVIRYIENGRKVL